MITCQWYVQHAAVWHWQMPLRIHMKKRFLFSYVHSLFYYVFISGIDKSDKSPRYQDVLAAGTFLFVYLFIQQEWHLITYFFENFRLTFVWFNICVETKFWILKRCGLMTFVRYK